MNAAEVILEEGIWMPPGGHPRVSYRRWKPPLCQALIIVAHGFGEHGGRYEAFAKTLALRGIGVAVPDLIGHGRSDGQRGDLGCVEDSARLFEAMAEEALLPKAGLTNYTLFGHSFGGLLAIAVALRGPRSLQKLIVQSPFLDVGFPIPPWKRFLASVLACCWPNAALPMDLDAEGLSHDAAVVAAYRQDPLVHNRMSARTYRSIQEVRGVVLEKAASITIPTLLLCGSEDRIVSVPKAQEWFRSLTCKRHFELLPMSRHELHHEAVRDQVLTWIADWTLQG
ncbi:MAG: lysophospholipase [Candidatus Omnitrophica bacterium]|nr:lysophospholipase [Candidatus Omnitrophota bacterium]